MKKCKNGNTFLERINFLSEKLKKATTDQEHDFFLSQLKEEVRLWNVKLNG